MIPSSDGGEGVVNILIVDDEPKNLTVLETVLDSPRYRVIRAESADKALLALLKHDFAVLILDVQMPGITGFELAQMIKERKKTSEVPIIFLTAYYNEDQHVIEGYDSGAVDYLLKPINPAILRSKVSVLAELFLKQRQLEDANRALSAEVAERRLVQQQLSELNETLEQRVLDRTEAHKQAEQQIRLLMNEVNHRSKNLLSVVTAIAQQTAASSPQEFVKKFSSRVQALAVNHDLLVKSQWRSIDRFRTHRRPTRSFWRPRGKTDSVRWTASSRLLRRSAIHRNGCSRTVDQHGEVRGSVGRTGADRNRVED